MKNQKYVVIGGTILLLILLIISLPPLSRTISRSVARYISKGAVALAEAKKHNCHEKDTVCTIQNGKVVSRKMSNTEKKQVEQKYVTEQQKHQQYAKNVAAAVMAIRRYTNIPDLNVTPLENSTPSNVTYYCTNDKKCWAVDNERHQVLD